MPVNLISQGFNHPITKPEASKDRIFCEPALIGLSYACYGSIMGQYNYKAAITLFPLISLASNVFAYTIFNNNQVDPEKKMSPAEILQNSLKSTALDSVNAVEFVFVAASSICAVLVYLNIMGSINMPVVGTSECNGLFNCIDITARNIIATSVMLSSGYAAYSISSAARQKISETRVFQAISNKIDDWTGKEPQAQKA